MRMPHEEQIMVLHRIAHYIKGFLTSETIKVKGQVLVEEVGETALGYAAKQLLSEYLINNKIGNIACAIYLLHKTN